MKRDLQQRMCCVFWTVWRRPHWWQTCGRVHERRMWKMDAHLMPGYFW